MPVLGNPNINVAESGRVVMMPLPKSANEIDGAETDQKE